MSVSLGISRGILSSGRYSCAYLFSRTHLFSTGHLFSSTTTRDTYQYLYQPLSVSLETLVSHSLSFGLPEWSALIACLFSTLATATGIPSYYRNFLVSSLYPLVVPLVPLGISSGISVVPIEPSIDSS